MKCERCGKNEAVTKLSYNNNGDHGIMYVCADCAKELTDEIMPDMNKLYNSFNLGTLASALYGLTGAHDEIDGGTEILTANTKCPTCGMTYEKFVSGGKLGCGSCYAAFHDRLLRPLRRIHGTYEHVGKIPERSGGKLKNTRKLETLKAKLDRAVKNQEFEKAAELRDKIKELKGEA